MHTSLAEPEDSAPYLPAGWFLRPPTPQFRDWYPKYHAGLSLASTTVCNESLADYNRFYFAPQGSVEASYLLQACYRHETCILDNTSSGIIANFNGALVILGLLPTLLSAIGPSVAEISLLSTHRPLLSFLISMGAPAIWPTRLFEYTNPLSALQARDNRLVIPKLRTWIAIGASLFEYMMVIGAITNIMATSIDIGRRSILAWGCTTTFTPFLWTTLACAIHVIAASSYQITKHLSEKHSSTAQDSSPSTIPSLKDGVHIHAVSTTIRRPLRDLLTRALRVEFTICANQRTGTPVDEKVHVPWIAVFLNVAAGIMGFIHVTFGIMVFSSMQFISVWDVVNKIILRYLASTFVTRLVLVIELAGLREPNNENE
jgi:hypothetical protein